MADITRDSFQDDKNYVEVTYQRGKDVLDAELNESQKIGRSRLMRSLRAALGDAVHTTGDGGRVTSDGATANQLIVKAGTLVAAGYMINITADQIITGLTTPGGNRTDDVYLKLEEDEISSGVDALIKVAKLGETSVRKRLKFSFVVDEGGAAPPADTQSGLTWMSGIKYILLSRVYRQGGVAIINAQWPVDFRGRSLQHQMAQDRNTFMYGKNLTWDGTTFTIGEVNIGTAGEACTISTLGLSVTPANGDCIGWLGTTKANRRRRDFPAGLLQVDTGATADHDTDVITPLVAISALTSIDGETAHAVFVLAVRVQSNIVLRDGTIMRPGDTVHQWGSAGSVQAYDEAAVKPLQMYRDFNGKARSLIDHNGYRMGQVSEINEDWKLKVQTIRLSPASAALAVGSGPSTGWNGTGLLADTTNGVAYDLSLQLPPGAIITGCVISYNGSGSFGGAAQLRSVSATGAITTHVSKNTTTSNGDLTVDLGSSPTSGALPFVTPFTGGLLFRWTGTTNLGGGAVGRLYYIEISYLEVTDGSIWAFNGSAGSTIGIAEPDASINHRSVALTAATSAFPNYFGPYEASLDVDLCAVNEWILRTGTVINGGNIAQVQAGYDINTSARIVFHASASGNWQLRLVDLAAATTDDDTGVAYANNTTYRMRIEVFGDNNNPSSGLRIRGYINGVLVAEIDHATITDKLRPHFSLLAPAAGGTFDYRIGRMRRVWNHLLTQDAL